MPPVKEKEEGINLTADEAKHLEEAFKDSNFRKLMADYVSEISDPKHREEQEAYISQLEAQNEVPGGKKLVRPSSGFVAKLMYTKKAESNESKLFLNIVYSEQVDEPTVNNSDSNGCNWSIPFALGPVRLEADKQNNLVSTFDCCFHPLSLRHAHSRTEFLDLLINVAKDAVGTTFKMSGDEVEMAEGYTLLRGVKYKSGTTPKALLVGTEDPAPSSKETNANVERKDPTLPEPVSAGGNSTKDNDRKPITPKYHLAEQGVFDIGEYTTQTHAPASRRPRQLVVRVFVDEAKSAADVNLDVSTSILKIAPSSKCMYELEVKLPYPVNAQKGNARFDAKKKTLVVTLPVVA